MSRLLPFWIMPGSWGLKGKVREEAEAYYHYDGEKLDRRLNEIRGLTAPRYSIDLDHKYGRIDAYEHQKKITELQPDPALRTTELLGVELAFHKISEYDYDKQIAEFEVEGASREAALLKVEFKHAKITENAYEKELATLEERPWIKVVNDGFTTDTPDGRPSFTLELEWNTYWVEYLRIHGYVGADETEVVERWFQDTIQHQNDAGDGRAENF